VLRGAIGGFSCIQFPVHGLGEALTPVSRSGGALPFGASATPLGYFRRDFRCGLGYVRRDFGCRLGGVLAGFRCGLGGVLAGFRCGLDDILAGFRCGLGGVLAGFGHGLGSAFVLCAVIRGLTALIAHGARLFPAARSWRGPKWPLGFLFHRVPCAGTLTE